MNILDENFAKHGVTFAEATTVFGDPLSITIRDPDRSWAEQRFVDVGLPRFGRVLVVAYTERRNRIRIISARKATRAERNKYEEAFP